VKTAPGKMSDVWGKCKTPENSRQPHDKSLSFLPVCLCVCAEKRSQAVKTTSTHTHTTKQTRIDYCSILTGVISFYLFLVVW